MRPVIGVTQRVSVVTDYQERRDASDQRWAEFLTYCDLLPVFLPNHPATVANLLENLPFDGFLLSGGNSLVHLGGDAPERDASEQLIVDFAVKSVKPLLGVCRGMQFIQHYFGVPLERIEGHVAKDHEVSGLLSTRVVNSFHQFGSRTTQPDLEITSRAHDDVVESIRHRDLPITGIMWHPERCKSFDPVDCELVKGVFGQTHLTKQG